MRRLLLSIILGLTHGVADGIAGLLLGILPHSMATPQVGTLVVLYSMLAFGGQPVAGLLTDRLRRPQATAIVGLLFLGVALVVAGWNSKIAVMLAGLGSAAFHVGGGAIALRHTQERVTGPALFASPGIAGLSLGGMLGVSNTFAIYQYVTIWLLLLTLLILGGAIVKLNREASPYNKQVDEPFFENHDLIMLVLLTAIALRSAVWNIFQFLMAGQVEILVALGVAAAIGKILGGILADWLGWRHWAVSTLLIATPLLVFGGHHLGLLLLGVMLLQSTTPVTLVVMAQLLPQQPATATGLALGLGITLGGLPFLGGLTPMMNSPPFLLLAILSAALTLWWVLKQQKILVFDS